ncbi:MAG: radical SAM protein [Hyphomicrobiales bacterium]|nr:radical SAM protein [Hyphomicrobiales bacterium]
MAVTRRKRFLLYLIKPSHYDDDGYVIQWFRSSIPSNSLASLYGLAADCRDRAVLGENVEIEIEAVDETNTRIQPERIARRIRENGGNGLVGLVGVQSNQFPRAMDIARPLRAQGIQVCIGGFHASGCLAMLPEMPDDMKEAQELGISFFAGEAEGRLDAVLKDAAAGKLQPVYDFMNDLPSLEAAMMPILPAEKIARTRGWETSFDAGRGCPFQCSFCTIINVQGRKSRYRTPDDVEAIVRANVAQGIRSFFITDDNLARNRNWEPIFDRLIEMREKQGIRCHFVIQVDTLCHKIPNFIEKCRRVGVKRAFIGLENINPDSLVGAKKKQNRIYEYREMLLAWKAAGVITCAGYILGFPKDTVESILRDIKIIQHELPLDILEFFFLTPLPGSEDHKKLHLAGVSMDPDMNKYDLEHATTAHPMMSKEDWERVYRLAWETYYTPEHVETIMRRATACGMKTIKVMFFLAWFQGSVAIEGLHPLQGGYLRIKYRKDRRSGLPIEPPLLWHLKYFAETFGKTRKIVALLWRLDRVRRRILKDPQRHEYMDLALTPVQEGEMDTLEIFNATEGGRAAVTKTRQRAELLHPAEVAAPMPGTMAAAPVAAGAGS